MGKMAQIHWQKWRKSWEQLPKFMGEIWKTWENHGKKWKKPMGHDPRKLGRFFMGSSLRGDFFQQHRIIPKSVKSVSLW